MQQVLKFLPFIIQYCLTDICNYILSYRKITRLLSNLPIRIPIVLDPLILVPYLLQTYFLLQFILPLYQLDAPVYTPPNPVKEMRVSPVTLRFY